MNKNRRTLQMSIKTDKAAQTTRKVTTVPRQLPAFAEEMNRRIHHFQDDGRSRIRNGLHGRTCGMITGAVAVIGALKSCETSRNQFLKQQPINYQESL